MSAEDELQQRDAAADPTVQAHGARVLAHLREVFAAAGGRLPFARYMQEVLYAPGLGYYQAGQRRFGAAGDFVTAPESFPLFGRSLARQCAQVFACLGGGDLLELGAGSGALAQSLLAELAALDALSGRYLILEPSADLRARQQARFERHCPPALRARVHWLDGLPDGFQGVVVANEVVDAMPVHRLVKREGGFRELWVRLRGDELAWEEGPLSAPDLDRPLVPWRAALPEGYVTEVRPVAGAWLHSVAEGFAAGLILIIDYGYPAAEYYHPQRSAGTLMCYHRHRAHDDPFHLPGLQDITAHVDFTALAEAAVEAGLGVAGYTTQAAFLQGCGILELAERESAAGGSGDWGAGKGGSGGAAAGKGLPRRQVELAAQLRRLLLPGEMGEAFKVLALSRNLPQPPEGLLGFSIRDERGRL